MADKVDKALAAYQEKFARLPKDSDTLIAFSQQKDSDCAKLTKKKHAALADDAIAEAKKATKKGKKGKKDKKKAAAAASEDEETDEAPAPKKKPKQAYKNGETILLSSDRVGVVRWFGELPSRGGYFYGVEFLGAFVGNCDGAVDGVRYFQTEPNRAKFFPPSKIRKIAKEKDLIKCLGHERAESFLARRGELSSAATTATAEDPDLEPVTESDEKDEAEAEDEDDEEVAAEPKKKAAKKSPKERSATVVERSAVEPSDLTILPADKRDTPLEFIIKQDEDTKAVLYDIFANPTLSPIFITALENAAALSDDEQYEIWAELVGRWVTYL